MKVEVLVSTVNANIKELIKNMNIQTDAIIINQCDTHSYEEIKHKNRLIKVYNFKERGLGLSRNNAIMRAKGDIVLFADDDEVFKDGYEKNIVREFEKNEKADMIVFNIDAKNLNRKVSVIKERKRVRKHNCLRYGSVRMAFKLNKIKKKNILITLICGAGTKYGSGEDSIFIYDCLKSGLKVYSSPYSIAMVDFQESSWFNGYDKKYFKDKGVLMYLLHGKFAYLFILIFLFRHKYMYEKIGFKTSFSSMLEGYREIKQF